MACVKIDKMSKQAKKNEEEISEFVKLLKDTKDGVDISVDPQDLADNVGETFDHHSTAVDGLKNAIVDTFNKVSEGVADKGGVDVDDGFVEDTTEAVVSVVKAVHKNLTDSEVAGEAGEVIGNAVAGAHEILRGVAETGAEAIHGVVRAGLATREITPAGMPDIEDNAGVVADGIDATKTQVEPAPEFIEIVKKSVPDVTCFVYESGAIEETLKKVAKTVVKLLASDAAEEIAEVVLDSVPVMGLVFAVYRLMNGSSKTLVGVGGLAAAGAIAVGGGVWGAAATPFDGGAALGNSMSIARKTASWSGSVGMEGCLIATKGAAGVVSQIPGTQIVTIPVSLGCGMAAKAVKQKRTGKASTTSTDADAEDLWRRDGIATVITKGTLQVEKNYNLISADGKHILQASNTRSKRGCQGLQNFMGGRMPHWAGYTLMFEDLQPSEKAGASASENEGASSSSFSFSGFRGSYRLHSGEYGNNTLFFLGSIKPREWVVSDIPDETNGDREKIELQWNEGFHKFKIRGHRGQFVMWTPPDGCFKATRHETEATEFILREASS